MAGFIPTKPQSRQSSVAYSRTSSGAGDAQENAWSSVPVDAPMIGLSTVITVAHPPAPRFSGPSSRPNRQQTPFIVLAPNLVNKP